MLALSKQKSSLCLRAILIIARNSNRYCYLVFYCLSLPNQHEGMKNRIV